MPVRCTYCHEVISEASWFADPPEPSAPWFRPTSARQITDIAADLGLELTWLSDGWVVRLRRDAVVRHVIGYAFPPNSAVAAHLAADKVGCFAVLENAGIPAVPHRIVRAGSYGAEELYSAVAQAHELPLVLKPNDGDGGVDVYRADTPTDLRRILAHMFDRYRAIAIAPFVEGAEEYRVVMLNGTAFPIYRKLRSLADDCVAEWRNNLRHGARPELVRNSALKSQLTILGRRAMDTLGLMFASVDILLVDGGFRILEVNSSVCFERFSGFGPGNYHIAYCVYREALRQEFHR